MRAISASLGFVSALVVVTLTALATPAAAQSGPPGQCECAPPWATPVPAPAAEPWQTQRWGFGVRLGSTAITEDAGDATDMAPGTSSTQQDFGTGGLFARYRWSRRLELELAIDHGKQQLQDGREGELEMNTATVSLLVHLRPQARWDAYVLGGAGGGDRRRTGAPDREADSRGHLALGAGVERRFAHLVLGLDVRLLALTPADSTKGDVPVQAVSGGTSGQDPSTGGGQVTFTGGWYF